MRGIGGNAVADIQVKSITRNEIGEQEAAWVSEDTLTGWLDLSGGDSTMPRCRNPRICSWLIISSSVT